MILKKIVKACLPHGIVSSIKDAKTNHKKILEILKQNYSSIITAHRNKKTIVAEPLSSYPVWVCWWQGEATMPEIVKICYLQLLNKANGHKVNLITKDNYSNFIFLPEYILKKIKKGYISLTHLSDIIRAALLSKYGGLWIDSTVFTLSDLPDFNTELFSLRRLQENDYVSQCRWTAFLFFAGKSCKLFDFLQDVFFAYWKKNNYLIHYFFIDYCIALAYENIPEIERTINNIPFSNPYIDWLGHNMNIKYDEQSFLELTKMTQFCKLSYRHSYKEKTTDGFLTYFGYIKNYLLN